MQVYEPIFDKIKDYVLSIKEETMIQKRARTLFLVNGEAQENYKYEGFKEFKGDFTVMYETLNCNKRTDKYLIKENTFKKLQIIITDIDGVFDSIYKLFKTLNLQNSWKEVDSLYHMVI